MKWFLFSNLLIASCLQCAELQKGAKKPDAPVAMIKPKVSKTDKEFQQKLNDLKSKQLQKIINFTPGFKTGLQNFFAFDWSQALKKQDEKKIQDEVLARTKRLQDDYAQLVVPALIDTLAQLGTYFSIQTVDPAHKAVFVGIIKETKNAQDEIYESIKSYENQAKNILGPLLGFAELSPSPYRVWYTIAQSASDHNLILEKFVEVIQPLIEANNTTKLENHLTKAKQTYGFFVKQWQSYAKKITMLLENLLSSAQQEQEMKTLLDRIFKKKTQAEQSLTTLLNEVRSVNVYASFIPNSGFIEQWLQLISEIQKKIDQWNKASKEWQNKFNKTVERHQSVYAYLTERKIMADIKKSFSLEDDVIKENGVLLEKAQKNLNTQKNALQKKKNINV